MTNEVDALVVEKMQAAYDEFARYMTELERQGDDLVKEESLKGIKSAIGFIRKLIAERMNLRYVPELYFKLDNSIEYSINLEKTFERIRHEHEDSQAGNKKV